MYNATIIYKDNYPDTTLGELTTVILRLDTLSKVELRRVSNVGSDWTVVLKEGVAHSMIFGRGNGVYEFRITPSHSDIRNQYVKRFRV